MANLDLLEKSPSHFEIIKGENINIIISAPHYGRLKSSDAKDFMRDFAISLGNSLNCQVIIVRNDTYDISIDPLLYSNIDERNFCRNYHEMIFSCKPLLVIELFAYKEGLYDIEVSTGFNLEYAKREDRIYGNKLRLFKEIWEKSLNKKLQVVDNNILPILGVYPLEKNVFLRKKGSYTLQLIKEKRNLGEEIYGLQINLGNYLGIEKYHLNMETFEILRDTLVTSLKRSFFI